MITSKFSKILKDPYFVVFRYCETKKIQRNEWNIFLYLFVIIDFLGGRTELFIPVASADLWVSFCTFFANMIFHLVKVCKNCKNCFTKWHYGCLSFRVLLTTFSIKQYWLQDQSLQLRPGHFASSSFENALKNCFLYAFDSDNATFLQFKTFGFLRKTLQVWSKKASSRDVTNLSAFYTAFRKWENFTLDQIFLPYYCYRFRLESSIILRV